MIRLRVSSCALSVEVLGRVGRDGEPSLVENLQYLLRCVIQSVTAFRPQHGSTAYAEDLSRGRPSSTVDGIISLAH